MLYCSFLITRPHREGLSRSSRPYSTSLIREIPYSHHPSRRRSRSDHDEFCRRLRRSLKRFGDNQPADARIARTRTQAPTRTPPTIPSIDISTSPNLNRVVGCFELLWSRFSPSFGSVVEIAGLLGIESCATPEFCLFQDGRSGF
jgi:hypothetical protein